MRGGGVNLKSFEEIIAMSPLDAQTELKTYPIEYYNKFNSEWHMTTNIFWTVLNWNRNTSSPVSWDYWIFMVYENNDRYGAERLYIKFYLLIK